MIKDAETLPSGWRWAPLSEFAAQTPSAFVDGPFGSDLKVSDLVRKGVPLIRIQHIGVGSFRPGFDQFISERKFTELRKHDVLPGDLVFAKLGDPAGRSTLIPSNILRGLIVADCIRLRIDPAKVEPRFLGWAVNSAAVLQQIGGASKGSTRQRANLSDFRKLRIPVPKNREEQMRIAGLLDQADRLRRTRRYALELSDTFVPAAFLEFFGDPARNTKGWDRVEFATLGALDRGRSKHRPRNAPHLYGGRYPFIQTGDIANCDKYIKEHHQTYSEAGLKQSKVWPAGTLCITIAANIGKTGILTYPACFPDSVVGFLPRDGVVTEYIQYWLGFLQEHLEKNAPESAQKNINLEILRELTTPLPPFSLQQQFAGVLRKYEQLRSNQREALRQADHLFQSLLARAFSPLSVAVVFSALFLREQVGPFL